MLAAALGHPAPTGASNQLPQPRPQQVPQEGLGVLAALGSEESDCKEPTEQQSPSLAAD